MRLFRNSPLILTSIYSYTSLVKNRRIYSLQVQDHRMCQVRKALVVDGVLKYNRLGILVR